jgi:hypothetical protein
LSESKSTFKSKEAAPISTSIYIRKMWMRRISTANLSIRYNISLSFILAAEPKMSPSLIQEPRTASDVNISMEIGFCGQIEMFLEAERFSTFYWVTSRFYSTVVWLGWT